MKIQFTYAFNVTNAESTVNASERIWGALSCRKHTARAKNLSSAEQNAEEPPTCCITKRAAWCFENHGRKIPEILKKNSTKHVETESWSIRNSWVQAKRFSKWRHYENAPRNSARKNQPKLLESLQKLKYQYFSKSRRHKCNVDQTNRERFTPYDYVTSKLQLIYVLKFMDRKWQWQSW